MALRDYHGNEIDINSNSQGTQGTYTKVKKEEKMYVQIICNVGLPGEFKSEFIFGSSTKLLFFHFMQTRKSEF